MSSHGKYTRTLSVVSYVKDNLLVKDLLVQLNPQRLHLLIPSEGYLLAMPPFYRGSSKEATLWQVFRAIVVNMSLSVHESHVGAYDLRALSKRVKGVFGKEISGQKIYAFLCVSLSNKMKVNEYNFFPKIISSKTGLYIAFQFP